jgi:hypothetical protein
MLSSRVMRSKVRRRLSKVGTAGCGVANYGAAMVGPGSKPSSTLPCVLLSTGQGDKEPLNGLQAIAGYRVIIDILCMMYRYLCIKK